jgi:succinate dehydrogenase / fumarate reductase cytochrome b subunit
MSWLRAAFTSSVGKKVIMSATGLFLCIFLVVHLSGNLLLLKDDGGAAFNQYSEFMSTNIFIRLTEFVLLFGFLFHILDGLVLTLKNRSARPVKYAVNAPSANSSWTSRNMGITGSIIFVFLVVHLNTFLVDQRILGTHESMYASVVAAFQAGWSGWYWAFYVVAMILLGFHLHHGFQSAFQSLGLNHPRYTPLIKTMGLIFSIIVPLGFAVIPIYFYFSRMP